MVRFDDRDRRARVLLRALLRALPGWKHARLSAALPLAQVTFAGNRAARLAYARFDLQARARHTVSQCAPATHAASLSVHPFAGTDQHVG